MPISAASAIIVVEAKKVPLCIVLPINEASTIRLSRPSMACIQARRTSPIRDVMLAGLRNAWMNGP